LGHDTGKPLKPDDNLRVTEGKSEATMTKKMTPKSVEQAKPGTARREIPDPACPGLYL